MGGQVRDSCNAPGGHGAPDGIDAGDSLRGLDESFLDGVICDH